VLALAWAPGERADTVANDLRLLGHNAMRKVKMHRIVPNHCGDGKNNAQAGNRVVLLAGHGKAWTPLVHLLAAHDRIEINPADIASIGDVRSLAYVQSFSSPTGGASTHSRICLRSVRPARTSLSGRRARIVRACLVIRNSVSFS